MDIAYLYCTDVPEGRGEFYCLPVVRMAKIFAGTDDTLHVIAIGDLDTSDLEVHGARCHLFERRFAALGILGLYLQLILVTYRLNEEHRFDAISNVWAHYHLVPVMLATVHTGTRVFARVFGHGNLWNRGRAGDSLNVRRLRRTALMVAVRALNLYERVLLNSVEQVYANSRAVRSTLVGQGVAEEGITVVSQGVDTKYFSPTDGATDDELLFAGRLDSENKRLADALTVFERVQEEIPHATFVVAGGGSPPPAVEERMAQTVGVNRRGYLQRDELREAYREASVLILTSVREGVPNVILEAQACGTPVVATDAGDAPRLLEQGGGYVVRERDLNEMAARVVRILSDEDLRRRLGRRGREYVTSEHGLDCLASRYRSLFRGPA